LYTSHQYAAEFKVIIVQAELRARVKYNFTVNVLDGAFFGVALGVASFVTVIPLFVDTLTDSTILIGLPYAIHLLGWQLPQVFSAGYVTRVNRYKPFVVLVTLFERLPYFGLALVALGVSVIGTNWALLLTFIFLIMQGFSGGIAATCWQSMINKIMPPELRGTFYGMQSAAANLLASGGAVLAGVILQAWQSPLDYVVCFLVAGVGMMVSYSFLKATYEPAHFVSNPTRASMRETLARLGGIWGRDANLRWFVLARMLAQFALVGTNFYTIFAVRRYGMSEELGGIMTGVLLIAQVVSNPLFGWLGDRWGHRGMLIVGALITSVGAFLPLLINDITGLYFVFALAGVSIAVLWTSILAFTADFGREQERPYYIGLSNTLVAPVTLAAPFVGGWLIDTASFEVTFMLAGVAGVLTALLFAFLVRTPQAQTP
jgi:MFS family permease